MKRTTSVAVVVLMMSVAVAFSDAQTKKTKVHFVCACSDVVGSKYATAFRDLLATSPRYEATSDFVQGKGSDAVWFGGVRVVSVDPSVNNSGERTVLAVTFTFGPAYVDTYVQTCSTDPKECAQSTFAAMDKAFTDN